MAAAAPQPAAGRRGSRIDFRSSSPTESDRYVDEERTPFEGVGRDCWSGNSFLSYILLFYLRPYCK